MWEKDCGVGAGLNCISWNPGVGPSYPRACRYLGSLQTVCPEQVWCKKTEVIKTKWPGKSRTGEQPEGGLAGIPS